MPVPPRFLHPVHTVEPTASARAAARLMKAHGVGALVLVDDEARPTAIVTDRDLALGVLRAGLDPGTTPVAQCASPEVVTLPVDATLIDAVRTMRRHLVRRLPIVDAGGRLVGILSADDLVGGFAEDLRWLAEALRQGFENEGRPPARAFSLFGKE